MSSPTDPLPVYLHRVARAVRLQAVTGRVASVAAGLMALFLLAMALDAWLAFSPGVRWLIVLCLLAATTVGAVSIVYMARQYALDRRALARLIETRLGLTDSPLINAVDLDARGATLGARALVDESLRQSQMRAATLTVGPVLRWRRFARDASAAGLALLCLMVLAGTQPRLVSTTASRLLMPWSDSPPYAPADVVVTWSPTPAVAGRAATVRAQVHVMVEGVSLPQRADLVWLKDAATQAASPAEDDAVTPMRARGRGAFELTLARLPQAREPLRFFVRTPVGRSRVMALQPMDHPEVDRVISRTTPPSYAGGSPRVLETLDQSTHRIRAITGSVAEITLDTQLQLSSVMVGAAGQTSPTPTFVPVADDATAMRAMWSIEHSGVYELTPVSTDGSRGSAVVLDVLAFDDAPPTISITEPEHEMIGIAENASAPLAVQATDDVGLRLMTLEVGLTPESMQPLPLWRYAATDDAAMADVAVASKAAPRRHATTASLAVAALGAEAGDVLYYQAIAEDSRGLTARSTLKAITVLSQDEHDALLDEREAVQRLVEAMADWAAPAEALRDAADTLAQALQRQADLMERDGSQDPSPIPDAATPAQQAQALRQKADDLVNSVQRTATIEADADGWGEEFKAMQEAVAAEGTALHEAATELADLIAAARGEGEAQSPARPTAAQLRALARRLQSDGNAASSSAMTRATEALTRATHQRQAAGDGGDADGRQTSASPTQTGRGRQSGSAGDRAAGRPFAEQFREQLAQMLRDAMQATSSGVSDRSSRQAGSGRGQGQGRSDRPAVGLMTPSEAALADTSGRGSGAADPGPRPTEPLVVHGEVERFGAASDGDQHAVPGNVRVVPAEFRAATEAYFRQLAQPPRK